MSDLRSVANLDSAPTTMPDAPGRRAGEILEQRARRRPRRRAAEVLQRARAEARRRRAPNPRRRWTKPLSRRQPAVEAEPPAPAGYAIVQPHPLIEPDAELDARLMGAGFSQAQAQLVYDLAAERLLPVIQEALGEIEAQQQVDRLQRHFGGAETWQPYGAAAQGWAASQSRAGRPRDARRQL